MDATSLSEKKRAYKREWYLANRERVLQRAKERVENRTEEQKQARRDYLKAHRVRNPAYYKAYNRRMYIRHKAKITAYRAWYRATYREILRLRGRLRARQSYAVNSEQHRQYYEKNKARIAERRKRYVATRREQYLAYAHTRRARLAGNYPNDLTVAQWQEIKAAYGHRCVYCGRKMQRLTRDHITPVSKGGPNTRTNVVPACHRCNSIKKDGGVLCPVQPLLLTLS